MYVVLILTLFSLQSFSQPGLSMVRIDMSKTYDEINVPSFEVGKFNTRNESVRYKRLKVTGITFTTIGGVGLLASGIAASIYYKTGNLFYPNFGNPWGSAVLLTGSILSAPFLAIGLPQLGIGIKRGKVYKTF